MQGIPKHNLLSSKEEAELSLKVKDWILLENHYKRLATELQRSPTIEEWAGVFEQDEASFTERVKDATRVSFHSLSSNKLCVIIQRVDSSHPLICTLMPSSYLSRLSVGPFFNDEAPRFLRVEAIPSQESSASVSRSWK